MESVPSNGSGDSPSFEPFTKAERIQQLNDIDRSITQLLQSAGRALDTLASARSSTTASTPLSTAERRAAFESTCNSYLKSLQNVDVGLHRQIYGLEEASIIPTDRVKKFEGGASNLLMPGQTKAASVQEQPALGTDSGMGKLDIGFLNSKSERVGRNMEAELWEKARSFLEGLDGETIKTASDGGGGDTQGEETDHSMDGP